MLWRLLSWLNDLRLDKVGMGVSQLAEYMSRQVEDFEDLREDEKEKIKKRGGTSFPKQIYSCQESTTIQPNHFQPCSNPERERKKKKPFVAGIISPSHPPPASAPPDIINIQTKCKEKEILPVERLLI